MKLGDSKWRCDRCDEEAEGKFLPQGWQSAQILGSEVKRDICPYCISSFRAWFYAGPCSQVRSSL